MDESLFQYVGLPTVDMITTKKNYDDTSRGIFVQEIWNTFQNILNSGTWETVRFGGFSFSVLRCVSLR